MSKSQVALSAILTMSPSELASLERRFWSKVDKGGTGGCWVWTGAHSGDRAMFGLTIPCAVAMQATRVVWTLVHGKTPALDMCHTCDNPSCVNPDHLFLGSDADSIEDARRKGRLACGSRHPSAVLNESIIGEIRRRCASGESQRRVGKDFGIHQAYVSRIVRRDIWKHVP